MKHLEANRDEEANRLERAMQRVVTLMALAGGAAFLPLAFYMTIDAASRRLGGPFTGVSDEFAGYTLAFASTWSLAYALARNAHVRIDVLLPLYPDKLRQFLGIWSIAMVAIFAGILMLETWQLTIESFQLGARGPSMLAAPLALPQGLTAIGFTMLLAQAIAMFIRSVMDMAFRRLD